VRKIGLFILVLAGFAGLFFAIAPENRVEKVVTWLKSNVQKDPASQCLALIASDLKDPDSARLSGFYVEADTITILYKSKNSFGGYVDGYFDCLLSDSGEVDVLGTELLKLSTPVDTGI